MSELDQQFDQLAEQVARLIALLRESGDSFWIPYLERGLSDIRGHNLAGATSILGCFGGEATFSDLEIGQHLRTADPQRHRNLNARLNHLRTATFDAANAITSRRSW